MDATGRRTGHGAQAWVAKLMKVDPGSVNRMLRGALPPGRLEAALGLIDAGRRLAAQESEEG